MYITRYFFQRNRFCNALVNLFGGPVLAAPVCQVLPPGFPGHQPFCDYTKDPGEKWSAPDMEKAKHKLAHLNYYRLRAYWLGMGGLKGRMGSMLSSDMKIDSPGDTKTEPLVDVKNPRVLLERRP